MKNYKLIVIISLSLVLFFTCQKEEVETREYPRLKTNGVIDITDSSVVFVGEILSLGNSPIDDYGFVWGLGINNIFENNYSSSFGSQSNVGVFSKTITHDLIPDNNLWFKSYAKAGNVVVYGDKIKFYSLGSSTPVISDFFPKTSAVNDTITITGNNFSKTKYFDIVKFNDLVALVINSNDSILEVKIPVELISDTSVISVSVFDKKAVSFSKFLLKTPVVNDFYSKNGTWGDTITLIGNNFGGK